MWRSGDNNFKHERPKLISHDLPEQYQYNNNNNNNNNNKVIFIYLFIYLTASGLWPGGSS